jgi:hypothetical protein
MNRGGATSAGILRRFALAALLAVLACSSLADTPIVPQAPKPDDASAADDSCVGEPEFMRRYHMKLLKHQRDRTVHEGIRTTKYSLANCVTCHANSSKTGRVTGSEYAFCENCHNYAGVKLDCFECHSDRPKPASAAAAAGAPR